MVFKKVSLATPHVRIFRDSTFVGRLSGCFNGIFLMAFFLEQSITVCAISERTAVEVSESEESVTLQVQAISTEKAPIWAPSHVFSKPD
ncbi:hypothetical protein [Brucella intermedia]|uniref:hypothetical protein n=1 Tax=Brucella intermedia TaxID=94625 RepID=UPI00124C7B10|nr:hypothetical protein [Brucella intermedia]KAB2717156.1 hypothetical protein F9K75_13975 [Brucella intermedia]